MIKILKLDDYFMRSLCAHVDMNMAVAPKVYLAIRCSGWASASTEGLPVYDCRDPIPTITWRAASICATPTGLPFSASFIPGTNGQKTANREREREREREKERELELSERVHMSSAAKALLRLLITSEVQGNSQKQGQLRRESRFESRDSCWQKDEILERSHATALLSG